MLIRCFVIIFLCTGLSACKVWNPASIGIKKDPISPQILTLQRANDGLHSQDENKIFIQELENNICDAYGEKYGYISFHKSIVDSKFGLGLYLLSCMLFTIPNILGLPYSIVSYDIEIETRIFDRNNTLLGKYSAMGKGKTIIAYYYGYSMKYAFRKSLSEAVQDAIFKIRPQIQADAEKINAKLLGAGKIKVK